MSRIVIPVVAVFAAATISGPVATAAAPTASQARAAATSAIAKIGFQSSAYGTTVTALDKTINSGPTSYAAIDCTSATGQTRTNTLPTVTLSVVGRVGAITTKVTTATTSTAATARTAGVNLLGGALVADAVTVSATAATNSGVGSGTSSTTFAGLKILGRSFSASVAPNTQVALDVAGKRVGTVTLNYQTKGLNASGVYRAYTRGIVVSLLAGNPFGLPGSTVVYIGSASAGVTTAARAGTNGGFGWGISATALNGAAVIGRQPNVPVSCYGGTATGTIANVTRALLISTGTTTVTTTAVNTPTATSTRVVSSVAAPRILAGLISADALIADAQAVRQSNGTVVTTDRSRFVGLKVAGLPLITSTVAPNTKVAVPGLGSVTFRKTVKTTQGLEVVMLEITLSSSIAGLPTGTVVRVAGANASVRG